MKMELDTFMASIEALLMVAQQPMTAEQLLRYFEEVPEVTLKMVRKALVALTEGCATRGIELVEVASGYRFQIKADYAARVARLWEEKPARYSRALLETLALIAYRQPITRSEIEDIRGVAVSTSVIRTLEEREWIRVVGQRDVPGRPALFATTRAFLDYFGLNSLEQLPLLPEPILTEISTVPLAIPMTGNPLDEAEIQLKPSFSPAAGGHENTQAASKQPAWETETENG